jgi:hypothetical protein
MRLVIAAVAMAALSLAACGKKEDSGKPTVSVTPGGYTVKGADGSIVTGGGAALAARMPDFAPVYPGAEIKASSATTSGEDQVGSVTFTSTAQPQAVVDFYKQKATAAGFDTAAEANVGVGLMYAATDKASRRNLQIIVTTEGGGSTAVLSWSTPKT